MWSGVVMPLYYEQVRAGASPPLLSRLYLSVLCNKIIKEDSALHCGRQRSPQTLETRIETAICVAWSAKICIANPRRVTSAWDILCLGHLHSSDKKRVRRRHVATFTALEALACISCFSSPTPQRRDMAMRRVLLAVVHVDSDFCESLR